MLLGIVQHGQQGVLGIGDQLDDMRASLLHVLHNGLGLHRGVTHGTDDHGAGLDGLGDLLLVPLEAVGVSPLLAVEDGLVIDLGHVMSGVDGGAQADGLGDHSAHAGLMGADHALRAVE